MEAIAFQELKLDNPFILGYMERSHRSTLSKNFQPWLKHKRIICLDIPDEYDYVEPKLVELLKKRVSPLLGN